MGISYFTKQKLGEGTYAVIYLAEEYHTESKNICIVKSPPLNTEPIRKVAIKKIKKNTRSNGIEVSAIREIKVLKRISHDNLIKMYEVFADNGSIHLVLEYLEGTLEDIIKNSSVIIMPGDIKAWMKMILQGLGALHDKWILHRDMKPNNILVGSNGGIKIADMGLSREISQDEMSCQAITRWYRPPEMLLGAKRYSFGADMWGVGCIMAELFLRVPFLAGDDDFKQLEIIFRAFGTPTKEEWCDMTDLPNFINYPWYPKTPLKGYFTAAGPDAINLLEQFFVYNPLKRITCWKAMQHEYFKNKPEPTRLEKLPK
ncbi:putative serine/threonine-protein kinase KIN28 like protein [Astathelohania contejeani]|uniref:[RNA-polymerase]-subunit kinase n=1 Tax=Astathelohania contejeani TaxID=164912 RepID=A0ABQ7I1P2_9MICR|nr:putative serine/threonine-protein kinase KIN28 like protein [Thelohania contejeani]